MNATPHEQAPRPEDPRESDQANAASAPDQQQADQPQTGEQPKAPAISDEDRAQAEREADAQIEAARAADEAEKKAAADAQLERERKPEGPSTPPAETLSQDAADDALKAMESATAAPPAGQEKDDAPGAPASGGAPGGAGAKAPIRGPRVVQGGREHRSGTVVSVGNDDVFLEFGPKQLGVLSKTQFKEGKELPNNGDPIEVVVDRFDADESIYICSLPGAVQKAEWELLQPGQVVEARVSGTNKGGLELEVANHRAFMPASQVDLHRVEDLSVFVGEKVTCQVIRVDRSGRGNITLSRREVLAKEREQETAKLKDTLNEGDEIQGTVRKIMPFGAFVDMGGIDGLLHISDLRHDRVNKVEEVVKEGDTVKVKVLKLDWENNRHSLGLKQLEPDPWDEALKDVNEGELVTGRVTKLMEFGCFVEVAEGIEGLVHISELAWKRVNRTSDVVQPNNIVKVKVLKVDRDQRKISLSIKQALDKPAAPAGRGGRRGKRGEQDKDTRSPDEILKETPQLRRLREQAKQRENEKKQATKSDSGGGLGGLDYLGGGLGDLKL
jgi:predicted RNA-binding protein with RPS1 domain